MHNHLPKKTIVRYSILPCVLLIHLVTTAQQKTFFSSDSLFKKHADTSVRYFTDDHPYFIIASKDTLPRNIQIIRRLDENMAIIRIIQSTDAAYLKEKLTLATANNLWKFSPAMEKMQDRTTGGEQTFILNGLHIDSLLHVLRGMNAQLKILSVNRPSGAVLVRTTNRFVNDVLLPQKEIIFIDRRAEPVTEIGIIGYNRSFHGINAVDYSIPGANGNNIVVGVKEQQMEPSDLDLYKRVLASPIADPDITNHSTVIASIIGGAGNSFYDGRGIAYGCRFFPSSFDNLFADDAAILNTNEVTVQNHSYGTVVQQFYGAEAVSYDALAWMNKNYLAVFSAGNKGTEPATGGNYANLPGFANLTGNFKMAKNVITVGAIDNKENIVAESSAGPLYDGRLAPQLTALGPNGTSDAAAVVSGTIAVMQQVYADSNSNSLPEASLVKAILYNSAEDIYKSGIDFKTGYGLLDSYRSVKAVQEKKYDSGTITQDEVWTKTISVPANTAQLKLTLAWTDSTAMVNNNKALINDLDLEVEQLSNAKVYLPWVLNTAAHLDSLRKQTIQGRDSLNTAEQVSISLPAAGNYLLKVRGKSVVHPTLPFHVAWHADTLNTFHFTSPQHASDVNRDENPELFIRWKTFVADTNLTGNLYISYNNRVDWQLLKASQQLSTNHYRWLVKDTSSRAVLKMETTFGDFYSNDFIISKVTRLVVDYNCADSFSLSWNKHIYATGYKIFALTDSPYLKHVQTVADTFVVMKRSASPGLVYAVEPVLSNNLPAARSLAFDITLQGTGCFYKTFYYDLQDQNRLELRLELSTTASVDSIYFELVTTSGQWLQTVGRVKVSGSDRLYRQLVNEVPAGTSYWRARIKLKSGVIVTTEIITVLTSGKRLIVFYPNPGPRSNVLTYVLQQGIPPGSRLQLFDMSGRLLKDYPEMPGTIDASVFAPGMIIYKLLSGDGRVLERGKLIVQ